MALVGAGSVGRRHAGVLTGLGATIAAVADPLDRAAEQLAIPFGCPVFRTAGDALDAVDVDAVYVCVPPFAHGEPEQAALERGLPFFVEKPLDVDLSVATRIAADVERAGVATGTGYHWRCLDTLDLAREVLAERPAVLATGTWHGSRPPVAWWSNPRLSGGQVVEQLTHVIDLARVLLGPVVDVQATAVAPDPGQDGSGTCVDDATAAVVTFASGAVAAFTASCVLGRREDAALRVVARGALITVTEDGIDVVADGVRSQRDTGEDPRVGVDRDFLEVVRGLRPHTVAPYADALETHRVACAIAEEAARHRVARPPVPEASW